MSDPTEAIRRQRVEEISQEDNNRANLESKYGQVWSTDEMRNDFDPIGFGAPLIVVTRKADGMKGSLEFSHSPRFYYDFRPA